MLIIFLRTNHIGSSEYSNHLDTDNLEAILHQQSYSTQISELMFSHDCLGNLPFAEMFKLLECGCLPKKIGIETQ